MTTPTHRYHGVITRDGTPHPLSDVPDAVLDAARAAMANAAETRDVAPDMAEPLADAVVMALLPFLAVGPYRTATGYTRNLFRWSRDRDRTHKDHQT